MLPQVLAGLGLFSLLNTGCLFWLERLQPVFFTVAVASLALQVWVVRRRPFATRKPAVKSILAGSLIVNGLLIGGWVVLAVRYR